jgi:hypothetical protein
MLASVILTLSIRFFLFEFILFKKIRETLTTKHYIFKKLFSCAFCQGFWCGLLVYLINYHPVFSLLSWFEFGFITAFLSFTWVMIMDPLITKYEENNDQLPMV